MHSGEFVNIYVITIFAGGRCLPILVLDLGLDIFDGVRGLNLKSDGFNGEGPCKSLTALSRREACHPLALR